MRQTPLDIATGLIQDFGERAKFLVDERIDIALQAADSEAFDEWSLVAKALALLSQPNCQLLEKTVTKPSADAMTENVSVQSQRRARG